MIKSLSPFALVLMIACTTISVEEQEMVDTSLLTPFSIATHLQVVDVLVDQANFNEMYENYGQKIKLPAQINWYSPTKELMMQEKRAVIEIKGATSAMNPLKSIGITFDEAHDNESIPILTPTNTTAGHSLNQLKSIRLRNSGSDFYRTMFRDLAMTQLAIDANLNIDLTYGVPVHTFVNGSYLGLLNLRSEHNEEGIASLKQTEVSNITLMVVENKDKLKHRFGDEALADELRQALKNGDSERLWELIDIPSFIDYVLFEDYVGNNDWPQNNCKAYSINGSKFRFILFDLDRAGETARRTILPRLEYRDTDIALIYQGLMKRAEFIPMLERRQKEIYSQLSRGQFNEIALKFMDRIQDDMIYQISKYQIPENELQWKIEVEALMRAFEKQDKMVRNKYKLD